MENHVAHRSTAQIIADAEAQRGAFLRELVLRLFRAAPHAHAAAAQH